MHLPLLCEAGHATPQLPGQQLELRSVKRPCHPVISCTIERTPRLVSTFLQATDLRGPRLEVQTVMRLCRLLQPAPAPKVVSTFPKATDPQSHAWKYDMS